MFVPCQNCKHSYPKDWHWYICDECGFRICQTCLGRIGFKCKECAFGYFKD